MQAMTWRMKWHNMSITIINAIMKLLDIYIWTTLQVCLDETGVNS